MEWDLEEALHRIHRSNMSKLGLDGKPIRRVDGKVLKGPNYAPFTQPRKPMTPTELKQND